MVKKDKEHIEHPSEDLLFSESEQSKLSGRQKLIKLFLTTELKNKHLWKPLREVKSSLIRNFKEGSFESDDVNALFRIYFHDDKDIFIAKHLRKYLSRYNVDIEGLSKDYKITLQEYLVLLKYIRHEMHPLFQQLAPLVNTAVDYAKNVVYKEFSDEVFSEYQVQTEAEVFRHELKDKLLSLIKNEFSNGQYTLERYQAERKVIGDKLVSGDISAVMKFAVLGGHLFETKHDVLGAFSSEQLDQEIDLSSVCNIPMRLLLKDFLLIIAQLNFRVHFFKMK